MQKFIGNHKWCVLLSGMIIQLFAGIPSAWGVYQKYVQKEYSLNQNDTSMIFAFTIAFFGIGCVVGGALQDKFKPRIICFIGSFLIMLGFVTVSFVPQNSAVLMYISFSLNVGFGSAFLYPSVMSCVQKWYCDKKGLSTGIIGIGVGLSGLVLTYLSKFLISITNIKGCFVILGIIILVVTSTASCFMVLPEKQQNNPQQNSFTPLQMLKTKNYYLIFFGICFATPAVLLFSPNIIEIGQQRGLGENIAVLSIVFASAANGLGRIICPAVSDKIPRKWVNITVLSLLAVFSVAFIFVQNIFVIVLYSLLTFCYSGQAATIPAISTDFYGLKHSGINYGLLALGTSVGSVAFPLIARLFGENQIAKHSIAIACSLVAVTLFVFIKKQNKKQANS